MQPGKERSSKLHLSKTLTGPVYFMWSNKKKKKKVFQWLHMAATENSEPPAATAPTTWRGATFKLHRRHVVYHLDLFTVSLWDSSLSHAGFARRGCDRSHSSRTAGPRESCGSRRHWPFDQVHTLSTVSPRVRTCFFVERLSTLAQTSFFSQPCPGPAMLWFGDLRLLQQRSPPLAT